MSGEYGGWVISLTPLAEGLSNICKYPGHPPDFACCDCNPRNQGLVEVDGAFVNMTLHMASEEEVKARDVRRECWPIYRNVPPIYRPEYAASNALRTPALKCAGSPSC
ncbi:hypothetical protein TNCV_654411 [Trichonephila clavipes]|nr:hypothetical protein TNCV_654411 [Trichonephila clavipes]